MFRAFHCSAGEVPYRVLDGGIALETADVDPSLFVESIKERHLAAIMFEQGRQSFLPFGQHELAPGFRAAVLVEHVALHDGQQFSAEFVGVVAISVQRGRPPVQVRPDRERSELDLFPIQPADVQQAPCVLEIARCAARGHRDAFSGGDLAQIHNGDFLRGVAAQRNGIH